MCDLQKSDHSDGNHDPYTLRIEMVSGLPDIAITVSSKKALLHQSVVSIIHLVEGLNNANQRRAYKLISKLKHSGGNHAFPVKNDTDLYLCQSITLVKQERDFEWKQP